jgi:hypothetical protein
VCRSVSLGLYKAHAHCDCCEAMHACVGVCVWTCMYKAHGHCDGCAKSHACVMRKHACMINAVHILLMCEHQVYCQC